MCWNLNQTYFTVHIYFYRLEAFKFEDGTSKEPEGDRSKVLMLLIFIYTKKDKIKF